MSEQFPKAPDNQPTSNIETMLANAKTQYADWEGTHTRRLEDVARAERMMNYWDDQERKLEWQLEQRREAEVNGL